MEALLRNISRFPLKIMSLTLIFRISGILKLSFFITLRGRGRAWFMKTEKKIVGEGGMILHS